jgi:hypothetical protein
VLAHAASNLAQEAESLGCRIEGRVVDGDDGEPIPTSRLVIVGSSDTRADDLLATRTEDDRTDGDLAREWLEDELADGEWYESREIKARAKAAGISERTLQRASQRLGVEVERRGTGDGRKTVSHWRLNVAPTALLRADDHMAGAASNAERKAENDPLGVTPRQDTDAGAACALIDPRTCIAPTRPTATGWRCERCKSYLAPAVGQARWRQGEART